MKRRYHVLRPSLDEDMVDLTEDVLIKLRDSGYPHYRLEDIQGDLTLTGHIFLADPIEPRINVVRYTRADTWYFIVEGHDKVRVDDLADQLSARLPISDSATLRHAAEAEESDPRNLVRLALAVTGQPDAGVTRLLTYRLHSPEPEMRAAAMESASLTQFTDLLDILKKAVDAEQDSEVKQFGATALAAMRGAIENT